MPTPPKFLYFFYDLTYKEGLEFACKTLGDTLPVKREAPIYDLEGRPLSWNVAYIEIENRTKIGEIILEKLTELKII